MSTLRARLLPLCTGLVLALAGLLALAVPTSSGHVLPPISGAPSASVTVCQVTGSASAPSFLAVQVSVDQVAAYLDRYPGSFVGSCPGSGDVAHAGVPVTGAVTVCRVSGRASAPILSEVLVTVDQLAAFLNQNPGSFVGACPASSPGGNPGVSSGSGPLTAVVTVCHVTGDVDAPHVAQLTLGLDRVAAFLNQRPGSFIGTCPGQGGSVTQGPGRILGIPAGAALTVCGVTAHGRALRFAQVNVAIDRVAAFLNQNPGSFVGLCPSSGDLNGTVGNQPLGYVTICRVTGDADNPLAPATVRLGELRAYLTRPGTVVPAETGGCSRATPGGRDAPPSTTTPGKSTTVVVNTTPNTVVTASGAGVQKSTKSDERGKAKLKVRAKWRGVITVRAAGGKAVKHIGVAGVMESGKNLTG
jgi:hypothetical protein